MEFTELAKKRVSIRKYSDKPVDAETLNAILEATLLAPTAKNLQPQRIYVLQSEEAFVKLDELTHCRYGAPVVLLFAYDADEDWKNPVEEGVHSGIEDVSIVATHAMLRAAELGVDTTWCNMFANSALEAAFDLPANEKSVLIMPVGYRAEGAKEAPMHSQSKALDDVVRYL